MTSKEIKDITALHVDKYRKKQHVFLIEGPKLLEEYINGKFIVKTIYALKEWEISSVVDDRCNVVEVSTTELSRISQLKTPNKLVAIVAMKDNDIKNTFNQDEWVLALDKISNPGNMGAIIRSADWFGIKHIVCSSCCVDCYNSKVVQATMGSLTRVQMYYTDLEQWFRMQNNDVKVFGAVMNGESLYQTKFPDKGIVLIGNESRGISSQLSCYITQHITIPTYNGGAESLNASVATAIILSEIRRQTGVCDIAIK
jgi:TrmH family RNA methyltransferase